MQRRCDRSEKAVSDTALLELAGTSSGDCVFVLEKDVTTVGRHPDSDLFLDDLTVSRMHAEFRREPAGFSVNDVGSLNGTYVNNRAVVGSAPLECGDRVQIGKFTLIHRKSHASKAFPSTPCKACVGDASGV